MIDGKTVHTGVTAGISVFPQTARPRPRCSPIRCGAVPRQAGVARLDQRFRARDGSADPRSPRAASRLSMAIQNGELSLNYQPQAASGGTDPARKSSASRRWRAGIIRARLRVAGRVHPARGRERPDRRDGRLDLREACREAASWPRRCRSPSTCRRSSSARRPGQPGAFDPARDRPGADRLELEITEGVLIEDGDRALAMLRSSGRSACASRSTIRHRPFVPADLQAFPFDRVKIDRAFVMSLGRTPDRSLAIVRAVIGLAHGLGLPVLAEGVETNDQRG